MFFSRAALEWLLVSGKQPDVIHMHDWQSAAVVRAPQPPPAASRGLRPRRVSRRAADARLEAAPAACRARDPALANTLLPPPLNLLQAPLLAEEYRARGLSRPRCVFTIHNIVSRPAPGRVP
jgi:hypothetical protein